MFAGGLRWKETKSAMWHIDAQKSEPKARLEQKLSSTLRIQIQTALLRAISNDRTDKEIPLSQEKQRTRTTSHPRTLLT